MGSDQLQKQQTAAEDDQPPKPRGGSDLRLRPGHALLPRGPAPATPQLALPASAAQVPTAAARAAALAAARAAWLPDAGPSPAADPLAGGFDRGWTAARSEGMPVAAPAWPWAPGPGRHPGESIGDAARAGRAPRARRGADALGDGGRAAGRARQGAPPAAGRGGLAARALGGARRRRRRGGARGGRGRERAGGGGAGAARGERAAGRGVCGRRGSGREGVCDAARAAGQEVLVRRCAGRGAGSDCGGAGGRVGWVPVTVDPKEHQDWIWATEEEVAVARFHDRELAFTSEVEQNDILAVLKL